MIAAAHFGSIRHAGHYWRSRDELISDVLLWTPTHGRAKAGRPAQTYIQQLCEDTGCCPEDLPMAMNDREMWRERVRDVRATTTTWWWWCWWWLIFLKDTNWNCVPRCNFTCLFLLITLLDQQKKTLLPIPILLAYANFFSVPTTTTPGFYFGHHFLLISSSTKSIVTEIILWR